MVEYSKFRKLPLQKIWVPEVNRGTQDRAAQDIGAGMATRGQISDYLRISSRFIPNLIDARIIKCNKAERFSWANVWRDVWQIPDVPAKHFSKMMVPLLTVSEVAKRVGVSERSLVRDGDRKTPLYNLPRHVQLSPRHRRYHASMLFLWEIEEGLDDWMLPVRSKSSVRRGLRVVSTSIESMLKPP